MGDFKGQKILITGGLGFIGSNLARALVEGGADVTLVDSLIPEYGGNYFNIEDIKTKVSVNITDVRDRHAMSHLIKDQDILFNLAGQTSHLDSMTDPFTDLEINATAQLSILESCRKYNPSIRVVFASTRQLYGKPERVPVDERHPIRPVDVNGINKWAGEAYHLLYHEVYKIKCCALRLTNTYGPAMRVKDARQTFLGIWINNCIRGLPLQVFGDGLQLRDFNYVDDVVRALLSAASSETVWGRTLNLGSREVINLKDLAAKLLRVNGAGEMTIVPFPPERKAIDIGDYYGDFSAIESALGWTPLTALDAGLERTLSYYKRNLEKYL